MKELHASYQISGTGPGGATFSETISGESLTVDNLAFGEWTITVTAINTDDTPIGGGSGTVTVHTNESSVLSITVVPFPGEGTLDLT